MIGEHKSGKRNVRLARVFVGAGIVAAICTVGSGWPQAEARPSADKAKHMVSQDTGIPAGQLTVGRMAPFADTGIVQFKVMDTQGNVFGADLDGAGHPVSADKKERLGREIDDRGFVGKLEGALAEHLTRNPTALTRVIFWMRATTAAPLRGALVTPEAYEANLETVAEQVRAVMEPMMEEMKALGGRVIYEAKHVPMAVAEASPQVIRRMATHPEVQRVYLEREHRERLNVSRSVVQANVVNDFRGITGAGQRVAVVEAGRIANHVNLPAGQRINCFGTASALSAGVSGHKTNVAGVIQSTNAANRGMASGVTIVDGIAANFLDGEVIPATDCVIDSQGAVAVNMSFGNETNGVFDPLARYVDRKVYFTGRTIVPAISNICANRMGSPEIAFNALAVGAFGDNNTLGFGDDISPCTGAVTFSAFSDPLSPSGDREEPDVVAPGHLINTTNSAGGFSNANGTSFAAPHVTGGVGLLVQRDPALAFQTERVRAIMMAAARHNIEGASRLSERDGTGGIELDAADGVLLDGLSSFFSTPGGTTGFPITRDFFASAGQRVRVAIAWSHKSPDGDALTRPTTDLDLRVNAPSGAFVASSLSFDNSYEIVDFIAPETGTYRATLTNFRSSPGTEFIGFAASRVDF